MADSSMVARPIASRCRRTHRSGSIGPRRSTTGPPMRSYGMPAGRSSQTPGLQKNADGSGEVFFGPKAPADKESNWVPTSADGGFEVLFRFYGPEKPLFDKTWQLPDIEKINL